MTDNSSIPHRTHDNINCEWLSPSVFSSIYVFYKEYLINRYKRDRWFSEYYDKRVGNQAPSLTHWYVNK
jgi:hypothetical protein